jgi:hypothetical protein
VDILVFQKGPDQFPVVDWVVQDRISKSFANATNIKNSLGSSKVQ